MKFILDTNIYEGNWLFIGGEHEALIDFIIRTNSDILMPAIVWDEIKNRYESRLKESLKKAVPPAAYINKMLVRDDSNEIINIPHFDINNEVELYLNHLQECFFHPHYFLPYPENSLEILARKGINRIKPFSLKGEEFRDAILWHTVVESTKNHSEGPTIFITMNTKEFSDLTNITELHPQLREEAKDILEKDGLRYYISVQQFLKAIEENKLDEGSFISSSWIDDALNYGELEHAVLQKLADIFEDMRTLASNYSEVSRDILSEMSLDSFHELSLKPSGEEGDTLKKHTLYSFAKENKGKILFLEFETQITSQLHDERLFYNLHYTIKVKATYEVQGIDLILKEITSVDPIFENTDIERI